MIELQVVAKAGRDAYKLLRHKVTHEARTWSWVDKRKTRLRHSQQERGHIDVGGAGSVLVARVHPKTASDEYFLVERFIGRLTAWFPEDLVAINVQFVPDAAKRAKRGRG